MSQRDVERTLGRLLTDPGFRDDFFENPARACLVLGLHLAPHEVVALMRVPRSALTQLAGRLDDRICRLHVRENGQPVEYDGAAIQDPAATGPRLSPHP